MPQAISATSSSATASPAASGAGLDATLARYQKQLADCVNCDSANTSEGKAKIQELAAQISQVKERLDLVARPRSSAQASPSDEATAAQQDQVSAAASAKASASGHLLDVYA